ncbi:MAG TPA: 30S ribosomal protein S20 [Candidatus Azoamicus sp. OHIO1]
MTSSSQSEKRVRQNKNRRMINKSRLSAVRTYVKRFLKLVFEKNRVAATSEYVSLVSKIDKSVGKGLFHKNKASRYKRRFNLKLKSI